MKLNLMLIVFCIVACHQTKLILKPGTECTFYDDIKFTFNSDSIVLNLSESGLKAMIAIISSCSNKFEIGVHSGLRGSAEYNIKITNDRAAALVQLLEKMEPDFKGRLIPKGYGESNPLFSISDLDEMTDNHGNRLDPDDPRRNDRIVLKSLKN